MSNTRWNRFWTVFLILNPIVLFGFGLWFFSLPASFGWVRWDSYYRFLIGMVLSLGLWAPALWVIGRMFLYRFKRIGKIWKIGVGLLSIVIIAATLGIWGYLFAQPMIKSGDKPPLLLVSSSAGSSVPDLTLAAWNKTSRTITAALSSEAEPAKKIVSDSPHAHRFRFSELQPDRVYTYQLDGQPAVSFRSLPDISVEGSNPFRTVFSGDAHYGSSKRLAEKTQRMMDQWISQKDEIDLFCLVGDITEMGFLDSDWQIAIDALSPVFSQIPLIAVPGNHDALFKGYRHYLDYLHPEGLTGFEDLYRRVDVGPVHFLLLSALWGTEDISRNQIAWLETQLASIPEDHWKVVVAHCYSYASGSLFAGEPWYDHPDMIRELTPLFEKYRVDLVVSGHNHHMEALEHAGVAYAIIGTMGAALDKITYDSPASLWSRDTHGWLDVTWTEHEASLRFFQWDGALLFAHALRK